jgi:hypothetical protein
MSEPSRRSNPSARFSAGDPDGLSESPEDGLMFDDLTASGPCSR